MSEMGPSLYSPAYAAAGQLFDMTFALAITHLAEVPWTRPMTITFFLTTTVWVVRLVWHHRQRLRHLSIVDGLFLVFVFFVLISLIFGGPIQLGLESLLHTCRF